MTMLSFLTDRFRDEITFELTYRCNLDCTICYLKNGRYGIGKELATARFLKIIDCIRDTYTIRPVLVFTGGEPFIREDALAIIEHAKRRGFSCRILTNGTLLDSNRCEALKKLGCDIEFSLNGEKEADEIVRGKGAYDKTKRAIKALPGNSINCVICPENIGSLAGLISLAEENGQKLIFQHLMSGTDGIQSADLSLPAGYGKKVEEEAKLIEEICKKKDALYSFVPDLKDKTHTYYEEPEKLKGKASCRSRASVRVSPEGIAYLFDESVLCDLKEEPFRQVMKKRKGKTGEHCLRCCRMKLR